MKELAQSEQQKNAFNEEPAPTLPSRASPKLPERTKELTAVALYPYEKDEENEISFQKDDVISNIEKVDDGWWMGTVHAIRGLFPSNFVQEL